MKRALSFTSASLTFGFHSLLGNLQQRNWNAAVVDAGGLIVDTIGLAVVSQHVIPVKAQASDGRAVPGC